MVGGSPGDGGGGTTTERERAREVATRGKLGESTLSREREREIAREVEVIRRRRSGV